METQKLMSETRSTTEEFTTRISAMLGRQSVDVLLFIHSFIHSYHFYSASSSPLLLRGAPDAAKHRPYCAGVTGQNIPPAGLYPGLKRPRLDYTRAYYGLVQFIPRGIVCWPRSIHTPSGQIIPP